MKWKIKSAYKNKPVPQLAFRVHCPRGLYACFFLLQSDPASLSTGRVPLCHGNYWWLVQFSSKQLAVSLWLSANPSIKTSQKVFEVQILVSVYWRDTSSWVSEEKDSAITKKKYWSNLYHLRCFLGNWEVEVGYIQDQDILNHSEEVNHQEGLAIGIIFLSFVRYLSFLKPTVSYHTLL